ncbi:hypothetical protein N7509_007131 [Penicillium cosmopolitanum]|uniref:Uncharacterized protein n=1 Tax=Penicillium cosmopolitanum TaxID=1131564 RepID=A0A9X0B852_9EURO|nr:uncharacterized protein N7509_007131 [Penicillium cosmopolitanum]KAJ5391641.1 hypothetical protein N7509_007131 [Penicillium cosmopolitanum]
MHSTKTLALLCLSASVLATAELEKKQYGDSSDDYYNSLMGDLNSLASETDYLNYLTGSDYSDLYKDLPTNYLSDYSDYLSDSTLSDYGLTDYPSATNLGGGDSLNTGSASETTANSHDMPTMTTGPSITGLADAPPASIQSVLITAIPESYLSQLGNPSARSSIFSEIADGHYPQWYADLPSSVKSWVSDHYEPTGGSGHGGHGNSAPATGVMASGVAAAAGVLALAVLL